MRKFYWYQLWFLIPGLALLFASIYVPSMYTYRVFFWSRTEAIMVDSVYDAPSNISYRYLEYADEDGNVHNLKHSAENTIIEGSKPGQYIVYYNPKNPGHYIMANYGYYIIIPFFPFALLLIYFGWPHIEETRSIITSGSAE
jgi:hypothetical protein